MEDQQIKRLIWISGVNGWSILLFAAFATLASLFLSFSLPGLLAALAVTGSGLLEVAACGKLKRGSLAGIRWAAGSQVGVFISVALYSLLQLARLSPAAVLSLVSVPAREFLKQLHQIDDALLSQLLLIIARITYLTVIGTSLIYQGGLFWYYWVNWRKLTTGKDAGRVE